MRLSVLIGSIAAPLAVLFWLCGSVSLFAAFAAMVLTTLVVLSIGCALLRVLGAPYTSPSVAWVLGVFAISLTLYPLVLWLDVRVPMAAAMLALVAGGLGWWQRLWRARIEHAELVGIALCSAVTLLWCHYSASAPATLARLGVLPVWVDYMIDGTVISSLGDPLAQGAQSIELAGVPRSFYHYASYLLPAAFAQPFDLPGLPLATSIWLPLGFFTMCAGAFAFGQALAGSAGGVAAIAALTLLPDASEYGLRNALFGFDFHVLTRANAAYGVGIALVSFVLLQRWCEERRPQLLGASIALAVGLVVIRAHIFLLALPCVLATAAIAGGEFRRRRRVYGGAALALIIVAYLISAGPGALRPFLVSVHDQPGTAYVGWYASLLQHYGERIAVPLGILLVFPAFLGVFTVLYPIALWLRHRSALDAIPAILIAGYAALIVLAPIPANGDPTEFTHRPFALVYAVVAIWSAAVLAERVRLRWLVAASAAAVVALWPGSGFWRESPTLSWGWNYYARALTPGLAQAAGFLRKEGQPGEQFAVAPLQRGWAPIERPGWVPTDAAIELAALSGMPAYLARPYLPILEGGERSLVAQERLAALEAIEHESAPQAALAHLAALGIRWYVVLGKPAWDAERAFAAPGVTVYRTTSR